jgi:hypothetical protein
MPLRKRVNVTLGILLPTRGRPDNLDRFITALEGTAEDWHLFVRLDVDDPMAPAYDKVLERHVEQITVRNGLRTRFGPSLNEMAAIAERNGCSHLAMMGDDVVPETEGWDTALIEALGDDLGVAYGDDGLRDRHRPDLPTHYVTHVEVYRRLGYLSPPGIQHLFLDNVARDIGRYLGNFRFVPVSIRHLHPWAEGEHLADQTYAEGGRNAEIRKADRAAYTKWASSRDWKRRLR